MPVIAMTQEMGSLGKDVALQLADALGIVKGGEARPRIDMNWFLNTPVIGKYWSSSPSPYPEYAYNAFNVNFDDGNAYLSSRDNYGGGVDDILVRLVRN